MTTTEPARAYLFQVLSEPDEKPVLLSQRDLDMLVDVGANLPEASEDDTLVDFAMIETSDGGPFLYHGHEVEEAEIVGYLQRGLTHLVAKVLESLQVPDHLVNTPSETSEHMFDSRPIDPSAAPSEGTSPDLT